MSNEKLDPTLDTIEDKLTIMFVRAVAIKTFLPRS